VDTYNRAVNAKARATQQENAGNLSPSAAAAIRAKADRKLNDHHGRMADHHLALHAHHLALAEHHESKGDEKAAQLHTGIAGHHLKMAESHHAMHEHHKALADAEGEGSAVDERQDEAGAKAAGISRKQYEDSEADRRADEKREGKGHPAMIMGAATQLHRAGHISKTHHDKIHREAKKSMRTRPFGSLSGAGHYMGDVDETNSAGTNA
jgi:hypothetical protein